MIWDDNEFPLAYPITFRTYGTWLHGDERRSVDLRGQNAFSSPYVEPNGRLVELMRVNMAEKPFLLNALQRRLVDEAIREVCAYKEFGLKALHVRTNHAHVVVTAASRPEPIATAFKSYATRKLRSQNAVEHDRKIWSRGESTRYLWKQEFVNRAVDYVVHGQGEELPEF
jgi:REP element-mobilizing transposase RayT